MKLLLNKPKNDLTSPTRDNIIQENEMETK